MANAGVEVKYPSKGATAMEVMKGINLAGKYFIVTGANTGIGFEAARALASRGAHVVLACRNVVTASEAKDRILEETSEADVNILSLDCADLASVEKCAEEYLHSGRPLHGLLLNAGVYNPPHRVTDDGFEATFQINHLSQFLFVQLLREKLIQSAPSRIVVVSSEAYWEPSIFLSVNDINWEKLSPTHRNSLNSAYKAYGLSKLCNVLFASELNELLSGQGVTAYSLHPGVVKTEITRNSSGLGFFFKIAKPFVKTPEKGAATSVFCLTTEGLEKESGRYFADCRPKLLKGIAGSSQPAEKLWQLSERMLHHYQQSIAKQI